MFRRNFIQRITVGGAGGLAAIGAAEAGEKKTVTYRVKGFSCITCAVGLEVLLRQKKGIARVEASYPKATVSIEFDPAVVTEASLKGFISEMGFTAEASF
jgi:copper chaperone CopZ